MNEIKTKMALLLADVTVFWLALKIEKNVCYSLVNGWLDVNLMQISRNYLHIITFNFLQQLGLFEQYFTSNG